MPDAPTYTPLETPQGTPLYVPRVGALQAVIRHWALFLLPIVLLVGAALALGLQRDPVYTSEARMSVGGIDVSQPSGLSSFAIAGESLATTYSRAVGSEAVVAPVARELGVSAGHVRRRVSATPIEKSPVFRIVAEGSSAEDAQRLADAVAGSMQAYVAGLTGPGERAASLFDDYRAAARDFSDVSEESAQAHRDYDENRSDANLERVIDLRAEQRAARLRLKGLETNYLRAVNARSSSPQVAKLAPASGARSDRNSELQIYLFIGLVAGVLSGIALASLRANRLLRRRLTA